MAGKIIANPWLTDAKTATRTLRVAATFAVLRGARGACFCYGLLDHFVHDANDAAARLWAFERETFVGRTDGVGRLWVNPLDWQRHGDLLRRDGVCVGLSTRLRGWDGRLRRCWVTSLRVVGQDEPCGEPCGEPYVIFYARPVVGSRDKFVYPDDRAAIAAILASPDAVQMSPTAKDRLSLFAAQPATAH